MTWKRWLYGGLALAGLAGPWWFNASFVAGGGGAGDFLGAVFANPASSSIGVDVLVACAAFLVWMTLEGRRLGMRHLWVYVVLTFAVAFAFSFPLFLFVREGRLDARARGPGGGV